MRLRLDYPMTIESDIAQLTGNLTLAAVVAFAQATYVQTEHEMCPRWRRRKKAALKAEMDHRWRVANNIRDRLK